MLVVEQLSAGYGRAAVLSAVDLTVEALEVVAVLGANGAGKTTLMRCLSGLLPAREGKVRLEGTDITTLPAWSRVSAGLAQSPEGRQVFSGMTVTEHLTLAREHARSGATTFDLDFVMSLFPKLKARSRQQAGTLSGGEQQMLAISRALMLNPLVLLLDEPSHGLAPVIVEQLAELMAEIAAHTSVLLVEQNLTIPRAVAQRIVVLENGRVAHAGPAGEALDDAVLQRIYLGA